MLRPGIEDVVEPWDVGGEMPLAVHEEAAPDLPAGWCWADTLILALVALARWVSRRMGCEHECGDRGEG